MGGGKLGKKAFNILGYNICWVHEKEGSGGENRYEGRGVRGKGANRREVLISQWISQVGFIPSGNGGFPKWKIGLLPPSGSVVHTMISIGLPPSGTVVHPMISIGLPPFGSVVHTMISIGLPPSGSVVHTMIGIGLPPSGSVVHTMISIGLHHPDQSYT